MSVIVAVELIIVFILAILSIFGFIILVDFESYAGQLSKLMSQISYYLENLSERKHLHRMTELEEQRKLLEVKIEIEKNNG